MERRKTQPGGHLWLAQANRRCHSALYTGHVNWYVDYGHCIRLVYKTIWVNGKPMDYKDVLRNPGLHGLLCDEGYCDFYRYPF